IVAGVDGVHSYVRMLLLEAGHQVVDDLGERPAHRDGVVERELYRRRLAYDHQRRGGQQSLQRFHLLLPLSASKICTAPGSQPRRTCEPGASGTSPGVRTSSEASPTRAVTMVAAPWYSAFSTTAATPPPFESN